MEICSECNGNKYIISDDGKYKKVLRVKIAGFDFEKPSCPKCGGVGKLNWLDNVFKTGKESDEEEGLLKVLIDYNLYFYSINYKWIYNKEREKRKNWKHWSDKSKNVK